MNEREARSSEISRLARRFAREVPRDEGDRMFADTITLREWLIRTGRATMRDCRFCIAEERDGGPPFPALMVTRREMPVVTARSIADFERQEEQERGRG